MKRTQILGLLAGTGAIAVGATTFGDNLLSIVERLGINAHVREEQISTTEFNAGADRAAVVEEGSSIVGGATASPAEPISNEPRVALQTEAPGAPQAEISLEQALSQPNLRAMDAETARGIVKLIEEGKIDADQAITLSRIMMGSSPAELIQCLVCGRERRRFAQSVISSDASVRREAAQTFSDYYRRSQTNVPG